MPSSDWSAPRAHTPVEATVVLPGSKSLTNRYLVLAALASAPSRIRRPLLSRDTLLMAQALRELGAGVDDATSTSAGRPDWIVTPATLRGGTRIDVGLAGTVMRFLPPVAALARGPVEFDGDPQARVRPMGPVLQALRDLGAQVDDGGRGTLPFTVGGSGTVPGGEVVMDASSSSQFVSALLLAGARFDRGVTVRHSGPPVPSLPHIEMTVEVVRDAGGIVDDSEPDVWHVEPSTLNALDVAVEPDLSNAGAFLAAALVTGGTVRVPDWPQWTTQAGDHLRAILARMGADVELDRDGLSVTGAGAPAPTRGAPARRGISGIDVDLHDVAELTPVVAALAALADSPTTIRGVAHIRGHETDRLAALATELGALGGDVTQTQDGLVIRPTRLHGGLFHTYADHRMVMAGAVLGLAVDGVVIEDVQTVSKTMPTFVDLWDGMLSAGGPEAVVGGALGAGESRR